MRILIAVDSFKGSATAVQAAGWLTEGIKRVIPEAEIREIPIADGGEGMIDAFVRAAGGELAEVLINDPLGKPIRASYLRLENGTAVIETAQACGLTLLKREELNPLVTSTYGAGQLILDGLNHGMKKFLIGIGGSATNDGGAGMARALGARFLDGEGRELGGGGAELLRLCHIDVSGLDVRLRDCRIEIASDVVNVLCGESGASAVYGPQKGATKEMTALLDRALGRYAEVLEKDLGVSVAGLPGSGAAGGMGAGLMAFCHARVRSGIETVLDAVGFDELVKDADLVITGEGRIDAQTASGKVPAGVAKRTKQAGEIPVIAVVGGVGSGAEQVYEWGIDAIMPVVDRPMPLKEAIGHVEELLRTAGERTARVIMAGRRIEARKCAGPARGK